MPKGNKSDVVDGKGYSFETIVCVILALSENDKDYYDETRCKRCGDPRHYTTDCPYQGPVYCWKCSQQGHKMQFCPN